MKKLIICLTVFFSIARTLAQTSTEPSSGGGGGGGGGGTTVPSRLALPINSVESLETYALELVQKGWFGLGSEGAVFLPGSVTGAEFKEKDVALILKKMQKIEFSFDLLRPNDWLNANASLFADVEIGGGREDRTRRFELFSGGSGFRLVTQEGRYVAPKQAREVTLYLSDKVPLFFPNFQWGYIIERDKVGNYVHRHDLKRIGEDTFLFPTYYAQKKQGELVLNVEGADGSKNVPIIFDLATGFAKPAVHVDGVAFNVTIPDVFFAEISGSGVADIKIIATSGRNPILHLMVADVPPSGVARAKISIYGVLPDGSNESPNLFSFRVKGSDSEQTVPLGGVQPALHVELAPGVYYYIFEFPTYGKDGYDRYGRPGGKPKASSLPPPPEEKG